MKTIIYNNDNLHEEDITETVIRIKGLIINDEDKILIGDENGVYQFPGGHLEDGESSNDCLKREILEETGIYVEDSEINGPFVKIVYMNKNYPKVGSNRKDEIYYYIIKTNKKYDLSKTNYTEDEIKNNYKIKEFNIKEVINKIEENMSKNEKNKLISYDMIKVLNEYLENYNNLC